MVNINGTPCPWHMWNAKPNLLQLFLPPLINQVPISSGQLLVLDEAVWRGRLQQHATASAPPTVVHTSHETIKPPYVSTTINNHAALCQSILVVVCQSNALSFYLIYPLIYYCEKYKVII